MQRLSALEGRVRRGRRPDPGWSEAGPRDSAGVRIILGRAEFQMCNCSRSHWQLSIINQGNLISLQLTHYSFPEEEAVMTC